MVRSHSILPSVRFLSTTITIALANSPTTYATKLPASSHSVELSTAAYPTCASVQKPAGGMLTAIQNSATITRLHRNPSQITPRATRKPYTSVSTSLMMYPSGKQMIDTDATTDMLPRNSKGSWKSSRGLLAMMLLTSRTVIARAMMSTSLPENCIAACLLRCLGGAACAVSTAVSTDRRYYAIIAAIASTEFARTFGQCARLPLSGRGIAGMRPPIAQHGGASAHTPIFTRRYLSARPAIRPR